VTLEVNAPAAGALKSITAEEGATVEVGAVLGVFAAGAGASAKSVKAEPAPVSAGPEPVAPKPAPASAGVGSKQLDPAAASRTGGKITKSDLMAFLESAAVGDLGPAVRKLVEENDLDPAVIPASGKDGRLTKEDVLNFLEGKSKPLAAPAKAPAQAKAPSAPAAPAQAGAREERVRMTKLRQTIARRLKEAQNTAAMLTTFNECDMGAVMELRSQYKDAFEKKHGVKLGFSSFFTKAVVGALQELPAVNARIDGEEIVYHHFYNIGMAVSTPNGLMVPVMRDCDKKSFAEIEKSLGELAAKGRDGKLSMDEMTGGTFTITNGGVFGSMMSTPILNMPQSAILGLHKIQERPMAVNGKVEIRPMMYLALSYDHRIIDGREAVTFLVRVKEAIEDPQRLLIGM
jgi:2-oxoglutarate dehydrogenase E2 component (dihydrolipoamide succinyltransferase)